MRSCASSCTGRCSRHDSISGRDDALVDRAKRVTAVGKRRVDLDAIADDHERRGRLAVLDDLEHPALREARHAPRAIRVRHRAAADDRAGAEAPRARDVRDQIVEREVHLGAGVAIADQLAVVGRAHARVQATVAPRVAELVGRDRERRERGRRLALEEAEALRELVGHEVAQRAVVREQDEANVRRRGRGGRADRRVAEDHGHLGFVVETPRRIAELDRVARPEQIARAALIDDTPPPDLQGSLL